MKSRPQTRARDLLILGALGACLLQPGVPTWAQDLPENLAAEKQRVEPEVRLGQMTYVSSRGETNDMVLDADKARILPEQELAHLEVVRIRMTSTTDGDGALDLTCDQGLFEFDSGDFQAVGNVDGTTGDGRRFRTSRVRYQHEGALVSTDEPVEIRDDTGTYRGRGFRYFMDENRFQILGGAQVVTE